MEKCLITGYVQEKFSVQKMFRETAEFFKNKKNVKLEECTGKTVLYRNCEI